MSKDKAAAEEVSPLHHVEKMVAPLLLVHGSDDPRLLGLDPGLKDDEAVLEGAGLWVDADQQSLEARQFLADQLVKRGRYVDALGQMQAIDRLGGEAQFDFFAYRASRMAQSK